MRLEASDVVIDVREGTIDDIPLLLSFIRAMAAFEKLEVTATPESLVASLFGAHPAAHTLLAFAGGRPVAYVVYFFSFSTMRGTRGLWLEDLFVEPDFRGKGIGQALMTHLASLAVQHECARFEWAVLDWNTQAIEFYKRLGATFLDDWQICRLDNETLAAVAARLTPVGGGE